MEFRELKQEDIEFVSKHSVSQGVLSKQPDTIDFSYCLEHEGKVLGIGGIRLINLTTCWCWIDLTHYAGKHIIAVYRVIKEWSEILAKDKGIKRMQAYIRVDFPDAIRTVEHLGFVKEFDKPMKDFVDNKDAFMYVKIIGRPNGHER